MSTYYICSKGYIKDTQAEVHYDFDSHNVHALTTDQICEWKKYIKEVFYEKHEIVVENVFIINITKLED